MVAAITQLAVGEALVTTLQDGGIPLPVERCLIASPGCRIGTISDEERATVRSRSPFGNKYDTMVDRESAFEKLNARAESATANLPQSAPAKVPGDASGKAATGGFMAKVSEMLFGTSRRQGMLEAMAKSAARNAGGRLGRSILRGVLGGISKGR